MKSAEDKVPFVICLNQEVAIVIVQQTSLDMLLFYGALCKAPN